MVCGWLVVSKLSALALLRAVCDWRSETRRTLQLGDEGMSIKTDLESHVATYGVASVLEELISIIRDDAMMLSDEYPHDAARRLKVADKLADAMSTARQIQN